MLALSQTIQSIHQRMGDLSMVSKLLIGATMVILILTLILVGLLTSQSTLSPLAVDADAHTQVISYLQQQGIEYETRAGQLYVPSDKTYTVLAALADQDYIAPDQIDFDTLVVNDNPFTDTRSKDRNYLIAKMHVLERTIGQMDGISRVTVVIDQPTRQPGIGSLALMPTAMVQIITQGSDFTQSRVEALAHLVAGSHVGLKHENVKVIVDGKLREVRSTDDAMTGRYLEQKLAAEKHAKNSIRGVLGYIPGVLIEVNAQVDTAREFVNERTYGDPIVGPLSSESDSYEASNQSPSGEAGVRPNTGASITGGSGRQSMVKKERSGEETLPFVPTTTIQKDNPKGYALKINASIGIPESFLISLYQQRSGDEASEPDRAALDTLITEQTAQIKSFVEPLIDTGAIVGAVPGTVEVYAFADFAAASATGSGGFDGSGEGAGTGMSGGVPGGSLVRNIGLGALVLVSLFMMFIMVKKASVREELPSPEELVGMPPALNKGESDLVGEAGEAQAAMEGVEIEEDAMRFQQMLNQINDMAKTDPTEIANLMRRWMKTVE